MFVGGLAEFLTWVPEEVSSPGRRTRKIRAGHIDGGHFKTLGVGLALASDTDVHTVQPAITVGIEFCFHPQIVMDPLVLFFERVDDLCFALGEDRYCLPVRRLSAWTIHGRQSFYVLLIGDFQHLTELVHKREFHSGSKQRCHFLCLIGATVIDANICFAELFCQGRINSITTVQLNEVRTCCDRFIHVLLRVSLTFHVAEQNLWLGRFGSDCRIMSASQEALMDSPRFGD